MICFPLHNKTYVVTFLALLELMKQNEITIEQDKNFADIYVCAMEGGDKGGNYSLERNYRKFIICCRG